MKKYSLEIGPIANNAFSKLSRSPAWFYDFQKSKLPIFSIPPIKLGKAGVDKFIAPSKTYTKMIKLQKYRWGGGLSIPH